MFHKTRKTVADVMSAFNKTLADLAQVEQEQDAEAARQHQVALDAEAARVAAQEEADKARAVAAKLSALISGPAGEPCCGLACAS